MLKLTGFVLPDVGILTITAFAKKDDPAQVTREDLDNMADYLEDLYNKPMGKYLAGSLAFTTNGGFTQPSWNAEHFKHKRPAYATFVLRGHQHLDLEPILGALDEKGNTDYADMVLRNRPNAPRCAFTGDPAYLRVSRDMMPMLNGRSIMNFSPMGESGLPVSDVILLAIHALPLGCIITQGALLAVESDDPALMFEFVWTNLIENLRFINLANQFDYEKYPNTSSYKTRLITVLVEAFTHGEARWGEGVVHAPSLNAYHFSNYGSNARVNVYTLPSSTVRFVWEASKDEHAAVWRRIVERGQTQDKPESEELQQKKPTLTQRNHIYEALFELPQEARSFFHTYLLRRRLHKPKKGDPRAAYSPLRESDLLSWDLTVLFLKRIMNMDTQRIDQLRLLGDRLAEYIHQRNDRKLLRTLYQEKRYPIFRIGVIRAIKEYARLASKDSEPLVDYDGYVKIFEEGEEYERNDWNLARDLLLIRVLEQLHRSGYLSDVAQDLQTEDESLEPDTN